MPWSVLVKALDNPNNLSDEIFGESAEVDNLSWTFVPAVMSPVVNSCLDNSCLEYYGLFSPLNRAGLEIQIHFLLQPFLFLDFVLELYADSLS